MDPASILKYLPRYGVLLCTLCTEPHCIPFSGLRKHILDYHQDALTFLQRKAIRKHALSFQDQVVTPADVIVPPFEETPIDGLHKTHGYECLLCGKLLLELSSMKEHCRPHGWAKGKPDMWTQKWMQVRREPTYIADVSDFLHSSSISKVFPRQHSRKSRPADCNSTTVQQPSCRITRKREGIGSPTQHHRRAEPQSRSNSLVANNGMVENVCRT